MISFAIRLTTGREKEGKGRKKEEEGLGRRGRVREKGRKEERRRKGRKEILSLVKELEL